MNSFISFSCLIALARTSGLGLTRSSENTHLFLVPNVRGKAIGHLPLSVISTIGTFVDFKNQIEKAESLLNGY